MSTLEILLTERQSAALLRLIDSTEPCCEEEGEYKSDILRIREMLVNQQTSYE